ncbi:hypothetical protein [Chachezhania antarctica]|uniref:hypothetical protein n=1 Tax=Chachezhania antarctica TaxID=2340860 RepID=UPI000EABA1D6|nr:hypothetical protein [Chachezhania antarctica]|tara:strand:+ start:2154 stop:2342 length:189 start_codon:yes stop_codon:yes gene_type:complete
MAKTKGADQGSGKDNRKNTSLRLDGKTLKALKIRAIEENSSVQKIVAALIDDYLAKGKKQDK